jgi:hypothetical protein
MFGPKLSSEVAPQRDRLLATFLVVCSFLLAAVFLYWFETNLTDGDIKFLELFRSAAPPPSRDVFIPVDRSPGVILSASIVLVLGSAPIILAHHLSGRRWSYLLALSITQIPSMAFMVFLLYVKAYDVFLHWLSLSSGLILMAYLLPKASWSLHQFRVHGWPGIMSSPK